MEEGARNINTTFFEPIYPRAELLAAGMINTVSARMFGNVILVDRIALGQQGAGKWERLKFQFIDKTAVEALKLGHQTQFMGRRAWLMHRRAISKARSAIYG